MSAMIPPFFGEQLFTPLPGAKSRAVSFSEWESYRTDVAGRDILVTTDDSNYFKDRIGKINGNTGDTDVVFLEMFKSPIFEDLSFAEWLGHTPPELVEAHLKIDKSTLDSMQKTKSLVLPA